jgi:hypothetical protein
MLKRYFASLRLAEFCILAFFAILYVAEIVYIVTMPE